MRGEAIQFAAAGFGVFRKLVAQRAGKIPGQLPRYAHQHVVAREIKPQRHAGPDIVLPVTGLRETVGGLQAGFGVQRVHCSGDECIDVSAVWRDRRVIIDSRNRARPAVGERAGQV